MLSLRHRHRLFALCVALVAAHAARAAEPIAPNTTPKAKADEIEIDDESRLIHVSWPAVASAVGYRGTLSREGIKPVTFESVLNEAVVALPPGFTGELSLKVEPRHEPLRDPVDAPHLRTLRLKAVSKAPPQWVEAPPSDLPISAYTVSTVRFLRRPGRSYHLVLLPLPSDEPIAFFRRAWCRQPVRQAADDASIATCPLGPLPPGRYELELVERRTGGGGPTRSRRIIAVARDTFGQVTYPRQSSAFLFLGPEFGRTRHAHRFLDPTNPDLENRAIPFGLHLGITVPIFRSWSLELRARLRGGEDLGTTGSADDGYDPISAQWSAGPRFKLPLWNSHHEFAAKLLIRDEFSELVRDRRVTAAPGIYRLRTHSLVIGAEHSYRFPQTRYEIRSEFHTSVPVHSLATTSFGTGGAQPLPSFELLSRLRVHLGPTTRLGLGGEILLQRVRSAETGGASTTLNRMLFGPKFGFEWDF